MRNISANALTKIAEKTGSEPFIFIDIYWNNTTFVRYSDKKFDSVQGNILQLSGIDEIVRLQASGSSSSLSVVLDDTDSFLKNLMDTQDIHMRRCIVYQYFEEMDLDDAFVIMDGMIASPIVWSEGERTLSFTILSKYVSLEAGFSPESGQFPGVSNDLVGKNWPLCFGSPLHVPATKSSEVKTGTLITLYSIPDASLPFKRELLEYRRDSLVASYAKLQSLLVQANTISRGAYEIQDDYANQIVAYDHLRQTIEDLFHNVEKLNKQIETLTEQWHAENEAVERDALKVRINLIKENRNKQNEKLKNAYNQQRNIEKFFDSITDEIDNCKYKLTVINKIRKKCRELIEIYGDTVDQINTVNKHIIFQEQLQGTSLGVMYGTNFPQNTPLNIAIQDHIVRGTFVNNQFTIDSIQPNHTGIILGPRMDDDVNAIWLQDSDSDIRLTGKYLQLPNNRIVKVTKQEGTKVYVELPKKQKHRRTTHKDIDYSGDTHDKKAFDDGLKRLLTGAETPDQIAKMANRIPKDISPRISDKLFGQSSIQYVKLLTNFNIANNYTINLDDSLFTLIYGDDEITDNIQFTDTADQIRDKILASTVSIGPNDIQVSIVDTYTVSSTTYWTKLAIIINARMKTFRIYETFFFLKAGFDLKNQLVIENDVKNPTVAKISINKVTLDDPDANLDIGGSFDIMFDGHVMTFPYDATALDIQDALEDAELILPGEIVISGGPLFDADFVLTYNIPFRGILVDDTNLSLIYDDEFLLNPLDLTAKPRLTIEVEGGYAFEYTAKQREKKITDEVESNIHSPAIKKRKDAIRKLLKEKEEAEENLAQDLEFRGALYTELDNLRILANKINQDDFNSSEAYKAISDKEYDNLYTLEITGYLEWVNNYRALDAEIKQPEYEFTMEDVTEIREASRIPLKAWFNWLDTLDPWTRHREIELLPGDTSAFFAQIGERVTLEADYQETYIANLLPSQVFAVYARKNVSGFNRLTPVPSSYYIKNEAADYGLFTATTITLKQPLKSFDETWDNEIFVSLTSSVGPNICDIIEWLLETFTPYTVDPTSFAHVHALQVNYPANFALLAKKDTITLVQEIAWQARCNVHFKQGVCYITYLAEEPDAVATITEDDVEEKSLELSFTETEDIITVFDAQWKPHYAQDYWTIRLRRNLTLYNRRVDSREFYIYNHQSLVYKSATFWLLRYANTFKKASFKTFLHLLNVEVNDCVELDFVQPYFTNGPIKGIVEKAIYDSGSRSIEMSVWLPVLAGTNSKYNFFWPKDISVDLIYPTSEDIAGGNAGNPQTIRVPTNTDWDPLDDLDIRPNDLGTRKLSDIDDELPDAPINELEEMDYEPTLGAENITDILKEDGRELNEAELTWAMNKQGSIFNETGKTFTSIWLSRRPLFLARVIRRLTSEPVLPIDINGGDGTLTIQQPVYELQAINNGKIFKARPFGFQGQDIPEGLVTLAVDDEDIEKVVFIPPVLYPSENVPSN